MARVNNLLPSLQYWIQLLELIFLIASGLTMYFISTLSSYTGHMKNNICLKKVVHKQLRLKVPVTVKFKTLLLSQWLALTGEL